MTESAQPSAPPAVGIDIGGTRLRVAVVDGEGAVDNPAEFATPVPVGTDPRAAADALVAALAAAIEHADSGGDLSVGIGFAGTITSEGRAMYGPNVSTRDVPIRDSVTSATGRTDVTVINDANAAAWGEYRFGAGRAVDDMVMLTLGTGVGGGIVVNGQLVEGMQGFGGELGHITLVADGWECNCGNRGCLEAYASGRSLIRHATDLLATGRPSSLADRDLTPADVSHAAAAGDELAINAIEAAAQWLGIGITSLVNVLDPAMVVVGGGVTDHVARWLLPAAAAVVPRRTVGHVNRRHPEIVTAELGDNAGVIGAADRARLVAARS
ncbi:MAG TPA: ROK family protein [Nitriliruptoraceae bacterium]|nr:ROK family protein [Nitriliruptoraceae bacterium]